MIGKKPVTIWKLLTKVTIWKLNSGDILRIRMMSSRKSMLRQLWPNLDSYRFKTQKSGEKKRKLTQRTIST